MLAVRLPSDIEDRLEKLARRTGRTKTFYAQQAIVAHLDELEDTSLALSRLRRPAKRWKLTELEEGIDDSLTVLVARVAHRKEVYR
jgi:RHH-type transcriptional regulator, rel operon repressor / antitoxin RelB